MGGIELEDARVVVFGSGSAGTGIAEQLADTIATETHKPKEEASKQIWYGSASGCEDPSTLQLLSSCS